MTPTPVPSAEREQRFQEVVAGYLEAQDAGRAEGLDALLRRHPDLAADIARFFAQQEGVARLAAPLRALAAVPASAEQPRAFGDYEVLAEAGRGGMGTVYKARQRSLNRLVA